MLLLTMNEWLGPGRSMSQEDMARTITHDRCISFATELPLEEALQRIINYEKAYNKHYSLSIGFRLLQISEIRDIPHNLLEDLRVEFVENLK